MKTTKPTSLVTTIPNSLDTKDYDPEYLKMIQSLAELDDFSIWDNLSNVEDEEFRLSDIEDDEDDLEFEDALMAERENENENDENENGNEENANRNNSEVAAATNQQTTPGTPLKEGTTITPSSPNTVTMTPSRQVMGSPTTNNNSLSSPSLNFPGWDDSHADGGEFYKNLEEELGSLMEEELEAAVQSLYTTKGSNKPGSGSDEKKKPKKKALTKKQQQLLEKQQERRPHGSSQMYEQAALSNAAFVSSAVVGGSGSSNTPVTAATMAAEAKRREQLEKDKNKDVPNTPVQQSVRQGNSATVTYKQSQQLRTLMRKHYQLLTQQAILSVRAAQAIKLGEIPTSSSKSSLIVPPPKVTSNTGATSKGRNSSSSKGGNSPTTSKNNSTINYFLCGENETELTEILDLAVGMLQDLDQNRKDAIRMSIQLAMSGGATVSVGTNNKSSSNGNAKETDAGTMVVHKPSSTCTSSQQQPPKHTRAKRSLLSDFAESEEPPKKSSTTSSRSTKKNLASLNDNHSPTISQGGSGRLTRAAFRKLQAQPIVGSRRTAFDIPGLLKLDETFSTIDESVNVEPMSSSRSKATKSDTTVNILQAASHAQACQNVLKDAGANVEEALLPGVLDVADNFSQLQEHLGDDFLAPCSTEQEEFLRKNRNLFTSGEDNLVLRGVNLYGEKQWILIGDRYLPDRSINIISQRYSKLCVMLYKAHGIHIDTQGNLLEPPKLESVDDIDETRVKAMGLKLVEPPAILNVHRWSMEEDLTILKAVPIMGHMWAELGARLIPHRDRGHLRKRYQVLERRVKATITRGFKAKAKQANGTKGGGRSSYRSSGASKAKAKVPAKALVKTITKTTKSSMAATIAVQSESAKTKTDSKKLSSPERSKGKSKSSSLAVATDKSAPAATSTSPMMSLESAAASLACIKPKETSKQAIADTTATEPTAKSTKRATLHHVSSTDAESTAAVDASSVSNKLPPLSARKSQPRGPDAKGKKHPYPHYPYPYHGYPGYYYPYPPHHQAPDDEDNKDNLPPPPHYYPHPHPDDKDHPPPPHYYLHPHPDDKDHPPPPHYYLHPQPDDKDHPPPPYHYPPPPPHGDKDHPHSAHTYYAPPPSDKDNGHATYYLPPKFTVEGKPIDITSPKPNIRPRDLDTPNSRSFIDKMMGDAPFLNVGGDETSRQGFDKLLAYVGGDEGSQSSRVQEMLKNADESEAAKAIVAHLSKSPGRGATGFSLLNEPTSNITGLSLFNESSKQPPPSSQDEPKEPSSIMARVLGSSSSNQQESMPSPVKKQPGLKSILSPARRKAGSSFRAPETPKQRAEFFATVSTPVGLSPGLRTLRASTLLKDDGNTTNLSAPFSPGPSNLLKTAGLATNLLTAQFSPQGNSMLVHGFDEKTGDENRFAFDQDVRVCEDSNQLGDLAVGAALTNTDQATATNDENPLNQAAAASGNSLSIAPEEFDAISGLGALSNSPFKPVKSDSGADGNSNKKNKKTKSFFARVVGESKEKSPQKKLKF